MPLAKRPQRPICRTNHVRTRGSCQAWGRQPCLFWVLRALRAVAGPPEIRIDKAKADHLLRPVDVAQINHDRAQNGRLQPRDITRAELLPFYFFLLGSI